MVRCIALEQLITVHSCGMVDGDFLLSAELIRALPLEIPLRRLVSSSSAPTTLDLALKMNRCLTSYFRPTKLGLYFW